MRDATNEHPAPVDRRPSRFSRLPLAAFLLGFAAAGFIDIVLLHQILQWHHFLSTLGGDLRWQVTVDGWYHAAIFAIAVAGLWRLWRARSDLATPGGGRTVAAWALIGLGTCYLLDVLVLHLGLDLHHVRMDVANPIAWDIGFVALFGFGPVALGLWLRRRDPPSPAGRTARTGAATLAALVFVAGVAALRPGASEAHTIVAFAPGVSTADAMHAALAAGGRFVWSDGKGVVVVADMPLTHAPALYRAGAMFVGGGMLPVGCLTL